MYILWYWAWWWNKILSLWQFQYTIQRYIADQVETRSATLQQEYDKLYEEYQVVYKNNRLLFIGWVVSLILLLIMVVILFINMRSGSKNRYSDDDYDDEEDNDIEELI